MVKKVIELFTDELSHYAKEYRGTIEKLLIQLTTKIDIARQKETKHIGSFL